MSYSGTGFGADVAIDGAPCALHPHVCDPSGAVTCSADIQDGILRNGACVARGAAPLAKAQAFWNASTTNKLIVAGGAALVLGVLWMAMRAGKTAAVATPNRRRRHRANPIARGRKTSVRSLWARVTGTYPDGDRVSHIGPRSDADRFVAELRSKGCTNIRVASSKKGPARYEANRASGRCSPLKRRVKTCHCSPPKKYVRMGARRRSDYAFGECFMYPLRFRTRSGKIKLAMTRKHIGQAAQRFSMHGRRYPKTTRARIRANIMAAKRYYGVGR